MPFSEVTRRPSSGLAFLVLAGTLWGTGGLTGSLLAHHTGLSSAAVATYRLGTGGLLLVLFLLLTGRRLPRGRRAWTRITVLGLLAAAFQASYFASVARVSVSLATLLTIGASPVLVVLTETVTARRRTTASPRRGDAVDTGLRSPALAIAGNAAATHQADTHHPEADDNQDTAGTPAGRRADTKAPATVAVAVLGLALLVGVPSGGRSAAAMLAGGVFALLAAAGFATMTLIGARPVDDLDDLAATGLGFTLGSAALAPLAAAGPGLTFTPTPAALALLLLLGAGPTAIAYAAYFRGLRTASPGTAALMALLEPLVGTVLSVLILGDRLSPAGLAGAALLMAALFLTARRSRST
jgi:DME family drug/metabolite transporter